MGSICKAAFGQLVRCEKQSDGEPYTDWRSLYLNRPGLIVIGKSEKKYPGKFYAYFYPYGKLSLQDYMHTACGDARISDTECEIQTPESVYRFEFGDFGLDEIARTELLLNVR